MIVRISFAACAAMAAAALSFPVAAEEKAGADFDKLLAQLGSDDFDTREAASKALGAQIAGHWDQTVKALKSDDTETRARVQKVLEEHAEDVWDKLKALAEGDHADLKNRARKAMTFPTRRMLPKLIEADTKVLEKLETDWKDEYAKLQKEQVEDAKKEAEFEQQAQDLAQESLKGGAKIEEIDAKLKTITQARNACTDRISEAQKKWQAREPLLRDTKSRLQTRLDQMKQVAEDREPEILFTPEIPKAWDPKLLSFEKRLKLKVTFEFIDTPMEKVLAYLSSMTALTVELHPKLAKDSDVPPITLRVTDMEATLALEWTLKLADLDYRLDRKTGKIVVGKKDDLPVVENVEK